MRIHAVLRPFACASLLLAACVPPASHVAQGQLYSSVREPYAAYFRDVHTEQVAGAGWADEKKNAHKSLVLALELTPDAPDVTLVQATHERASRYSSRPGTLRLEVSGTDAHVVGPGSGDGASLFHAVEETTHAELERAKRMHAEEPKLDALAKTGHELETHVEEDYAKWGTQKLAEVKGELTASFDALDGLRASARRESRESEDVVADLQRAVETASPDHATKGMTAPRPATPVAERPKADKPKSDRPVAPPAARPTDPAPPPAPKPPPARPADTGEVFAP